MQKVVWFWSSRYGRVVPMTPEAAERAVQSATTPITTNSRGPKDRPRVTRAMLRGGESHVSDRGSRRRGPTP